MRIIKKGKISEEKEYELQCKNCSTVFAFFRKEVDFHYDQRDGNFVSVSCPLCKKLITTMMI